MGSAFPSAGQLGDADLGASEMQQALLGLLRLQTTVMAAPAPLAGLRTMVDMLYASDGTIRVAVGVLHPERDLIRYVAHAGRPEDRHANLLIEATPMAAQAMDTGQLVQLTHVHDGVAHACVHVPIVGSARTLGFFGIGMRGAVPIEAWREEMIWAAADLMALLVLDLDGDAIGEADAESPLGSLTARQREVLLDLVSHGEGNAQIAERLGMNTLTVKVHLQAIYRKLGVHNRAEAISTVLNEHRAWLATQRSWRRDWPDAV